MDTSTASQKTHDERAGEMAGVLILLLLAGLVGYWFGERTTTTQPESTPTNTASTTMCSSACSPPPAYVTGASPTTFFWTNETVHGVFNNVTVESGFHEYGNLTEAGFSQKQSSNLVTWSNGTQKVENQIIYVSVTLEGVFWEQGSNPPYLNGTVVQSWNLYSYSVNPWLNTIQFNGNVGKVQSNSTTQSWNSSYDSGLVSTVQSFVSSGFNQ